MSIQLGQQRRIHTKPVKKLNVQMLREGEVQLAFAKRMEETLASAPEYTSAEEEWSSLKDNVYKAAADIVVYKTRSIVTGSMTTT